MKSIAARLNTVHKNLNKLEKVNVKATAHLIKRSDERNINMHSIMVIMEKAIQLHRQEILHKIKTIPQRVMIVRKNINLICMISKRDDFLAVDMVTVYKEDGEKNHNCTMVYNLK